MKDKIDVAILTMFFISFVFFACVFYADLLIFLLQLAFKFKVH